VPGLEQDAEGSRIVREELRLLATVQKALDAASGADASAAKGRAADDARLLELRDDVAVAKPEDLPALFEQMHTLGALRAQRGRSASGFVDRSSPYFGHLRLEEAVDDERGSRAAPRPGSKPAARPSRRRDVLIGARSYVDSGEGIRIVDWRNAPVSRIYYRYAEGDDYEELLGNRVVEGLVVARRGVSIVGGRLARVSAPQGTFVLLADGRWRRTAGMFAKLETEKRWTARRGGEAREAKLGVGADGQLRQDKHLPAIAAMLDQRQFELIARDAAGLVAIQGSAGSGKTTVGLHRVAYLAFNDPARFRPEKMFVVVPNEALIHYVSRVLPGLGVEGVPVSTFARFAVRLVMHLFPRLPSRISEETPPVVARAKSHPALLRAVAGLAGRVAGDIEGKLRAFAGRWPGGEQVLAAWDATSDGGASPDGRVSMMSQWAAGKRSLGAAPHASSLAEVTRSALEALLSDARPQTRSVTGLWDELLTSKEMLSEAFASVPGFGPMQIDLVHDWCVRQARIRAEGERDGDQPSLDAEDLALLLRCWQALRGPVPDADGKPIRLNHVFVDEVQDASAVELRVLIDLAGKERCVTLAGDVAQRTGTVPGAGEGDDQGEFDWNALLDDLDVPHTKIEPLKVSYRSTAEITDFARSVLGPLAHDEVPETTRSGPPVELFTFASQGEAVAWLAEALKQLARDEPEANVALIARFPQQAASYYEGLALAEVPEVRRIAKQDFSWEPGVDVTDVLQTKGLEFDEVVLLETTAASYPVNAQARHSLYVGATRASHQLWCVASEAPSELVRKLRAQTDDQST
jgi:DNA helicase-2/ATP-dependent DNA helicase PcrA